MKSPNNRDETTNFAELHASSSRMRARSTAPLAMLALLGVQFLVGMAVNLYVHLPSNGTTMMQMMGNGPLLMLHMMLGMVLAVGAVVSVAVAAPFGRRAVTYAAIALGGIVSAGLGGVVFLMDGQGNGASYLMAVGFLVAVGGYVAELVTTE